MAHNINSNTWQSSAVSITMDHDKCCGHRECVISCPVEVYKIRKGKTAPINIDECIECGTCVKACPEEAIIHSSWSD